METQHQEEKAAMELELALKITKTRENLTSRILITKDCNPLFQSKETETLFILIGYLSGFKKDKIKIEINEAGTEISISGEKYIQEMVLVRWQMHLKEEGVKRFKKVFRIPNSVILDRIEARFDEDGAILSIYMPKLIEGAVLGIKIEEVKEGKIDQSKTDELKMEKDGVAETSETPKIRHEKGDVISPNDQMPNIENSPLKSEEILATPTTRIQDTDQEFQKAKEPEEGQKPHKFGTVDLENSPFEIAESPVQPTTTKLQGPDQETLTSRDIKQELHQSETTDPQNSPPEIAESPKIPTTNIDISQDPDQGNLQLKEFELDPIPHQSNIPDSDNSPLETTESPETPMTEQPDRETPRSILLEPDRTPLRSETPDPPTSEENEHQSPPEIKIPEDFETPAKAEKEETKKQEFSATKLKIPEEAQEHENFATKITAPNPDALEPMEIKPNQEHRALEPDLTSSQWAPDDGGQADEDNFPEPESEEEKKRSFPFCSPCMFAGSAFIISLIVFIVQLLRNRRQ